MALQHHFVVVVEEDGLMTIDYDTSVNFDNGDVWDDTKEQWFSRNDDDVNESYEVAEEKLLKLLQTTWERNK